MRISPLESRIASIDLFRALNMFLMIFVIDAMTLSDIPEWIGHTEMQEDGMGLADVVFPAFLFIVGMSIPHAISTRERSNRSKMKTIQHIFVRTFSLVLMGIFIVNLDSMNGDLSLLPKSIWQLLMGIAFFLIWNSYPNGLAFGKIPEWVMKALGGVVLIFLAYTYKSGSPDDPSWMKIHWWGILGLIGWSYGLCSILYLLFRDNLLMIGGALLVFILLNIQEFVPIFGSSVRFVISSSNYSCVMSGVFVSVLVSHLKSNGNGQKVLFSLIGLALLLFVFGFATRSEWGISKIMATPSWTTISIGISILFFALLYWIADLRNWVSWAKPLEPAGRNTLTCYVLPYLVWAMMSLCGWWWPSVLSSGLPGLLKSFVFSFLIIYPVGVLNRYVGIRLKL